MRSCRTRSRPGRRSRRRGAAAAVLLVAVAGCAPRIEPVTPPVALPDTLAPGAPNDVPAGPWWTQLDDPDLAALIDTALRGNFSLRATWDRLRQAEAAHTAARAPLLPAADGSAGAGRSASHTEPRPTAYANSFSLGAMVSYEVDLWGRVRSTADAAALDARAAAEDIRAAAMTLTGQVAATWYRVVELRRQLALLDEQIATNSEVLEIVTLNFRRGRVGATDVLQQRQVLERTRGERELVGRQLAAQTTALAVLIGENPGDYIPPPAEGLPAPGDLPPLPVPAAWLRARPDIRTAELRVAAADKRTAAAIANQFPRVTLSGSAETTARRVRDLFDNWLASLAASLTAPLFDAGLRRAEVARSRAAAAERLNAYGQTLLTALGEVTSALAEEAHQRRYVASLAEQLELSDASVERIRENYTKGAMEFTRFLTTQLSHQQLQRTHLTARRELLDRRIALHRALGWRGDLPAPALPPRRVTGPVERFLSIFNADPKPSRDGKERGQQP